MGDIGCRASEMLGGKVFFFAPTLDAALPRRFPTEKPDDSTSAGHSPFGGMI